MVTINELITEWDYLVGQWREENDKGPKDNPSADELDRFVRSKFEGEETSEASES